MPDRSYCIGGQGHDTTKEGCGRGRQRKPLTEPCADLSTGGCSKSFKCLTEATRHPCPGFHKGWEPLGEDFALPAGIATVEFTHREAQLDSASCTGSITQDSAVVAMEG